jgi:tagatose-1,6-bisphosphate aldolase
MTQQERTTTTLDAIADDNGVFSIVAMDQRNTLRRMFAAVGRPDVTDDEMYGIKADVAAALTPLASGILLDPTYGVPGVTRANALADSCGLLVAAEPAERGDWHGEPHAHRIPEQNAAWVRDMGGHAVKFLVQLRPDRPRPAGTPDLVGEVLDVVREVVEDCRAQGIPSVIENLVYRLPGEDELTPAQREDQIVESARLLDETGADLLKLEYPGSAKGCRRIADVITRPWAVLSAGVPFADFENVVQVACGEGGVSGFIAGRSIWKESVGLTGRERAEFLDTVAKPRLAALVAAVDGRARPWKEAVTP